ncbi:hypothetical protein CALCODRAFT_496783 [Calocera cornea HHB12733]|uniref:GATA-type domain-containing protein n=1 Tax=Calocera cornea HHB12733 TaxID=1353952 RepID=A0A165FMF9_9BASI|nr:hypothetical protein CALCODRAFT_496783 [Calocera cornea HHB12733]
MLHSLHSFSSYAPTPLSALRTHHSPPLPAPSSMPSQPTQASTLSTSPNSAATPTQPLDPTIYGYAPVSSITYQNGTHSLSHQGGLVRGPESTGDLSSISGDDSRGSSVSLHSKVPNVPPVGKHRCYWALLSESLKFLYLDPVLSTHMADQANALIGTHLLDYVHPEDKDKAVEDLKRVVRSKTLHGSVTRLRYRRATNIREVLGGTDLAPVPDAPLFCLDEEYLICDLVINCVGDNLVLCFFHAIVDKRPLEDQSEAQKSEWSNWCGAPSDLSLVEYAADMYTALIPNSQFANNHPQRVFQILKLEGRGIVFTWPLNGYEVLEFGGIARDVNIGGSGAVSEARTSCTRRYKANWRGQLSGMPAEVESVYIPYGSIIFACHRAQFSGGLEPHNLLRSTYYNNAPYVQANSQNGNYNAHTPTSATTPGSYGPGYSPQTYGPAQYSGSFPTPQSATHGGPWPGTTIPPSPPLSASQATPMSAISTQQYTSQLLAAQQGSQTSPPSAQYGYPRQSSPNTSPQSAHPGGSSEGASGATPNQPKRPTRPPTGVQACVQCGNTTSPEWRKGPSGNKDLCNACGLRWSRTKAKEEGGDRLKRGKRKKKGALAEEDEEDGKRRTKRKGENSPSPIPLLPQSTQQQPMHVPQPVQHLIHPTLLGGPQPQHLHGIMGAGLGLGMAGWTTQVHHPYAGEGLKVIVREPQSLDQPLLRKLPSMEDMFLLPTGLV